MKILIKNSVTGNLDLVSQFVFDNKKYIAQYKDSPWVKISGRSFDMSGNFSPDDLKGISRFSQAETLGNGSIVHEPETVEINGPRNTILYKIATDEKWVKQKKR